MRSAALSDSDPHGVFVVYALPVHHLRVAAALGVVALLTGCGSSGNGAGSRGGTSGPEIPIASMRWNKADALTIARHIPGCRNVTRHTPQNDFERSMASLATCQLGNTTVTIEDVRPDVSSSAEGTMPWKYQVVGYGWFATVDVRAAAEQVAAALGGRVYP